MLHTRKYIYVTENQFCYAKSRKYKTNNVDKIRTLIFSPIESTYKFAVRFRVFRNYSETTAINLKLSLFVNTYKLQGAG